MSQIRLKKRGFTLIELLVVISIIALLMAILVPVIRRAKGAAMSAFCLSNLHNLSMAWFTYSVDNRGLLVGALNGRSDGLSADPKYGYSWVTQPQDEDGSYLSYHNAKSEDKLRGIERGLLFPYVKNLDVYHCPSDRRFKRPAPAGYKSSAFRSYSIAGGMNGTLWVDSMTKIYHPCKLYSQIKRPAEKYVFVEDDDPRGFNVHTWEVDITKTRWLDVPALWHYNKSNLGFADGHAETHMWMDKRTLKLREAKTEEEVNLIKDEDQEGNQDLKYMQDHYTVMLGPEE